MSLETTVSGTRPNVFLSDVRVYIAGVLMPVTHVTVRSGAGQMPEASISLPPYPDLFVVGRMDRIPVHIFVRESVVGSGRLILLFEGAIVSKQYLCLASQREINVSAVSWAAILDDVRLEFMTTLDDIVRRSLSGELDKSLASYQFGLQFPLLLFLHGLGAEGMPEPIRTPVQYLENIYRFIASAGELEAVAPFNGSALAGFFRQYARDIRLIQRFESIPFFDRAAVPDRKREMDGNGQGKEEEVTAWHLAKFSEQTATMFPLVYGMQQGAALAQLAGRAVEASRKMSMAELLKFLVDELEYEFLVFASPAFHSESPEKKKENPELRDRLIASALKPLLFDALPPCCNVLYRSQVLRIEAAEQYSGVPTRVQIRDLHGPLALLTSGVADSVLAQYGLIDYYPSEKFVDFSRGNLQVYEKALGTELLATETHTGPWVAEVGTPRWFSYIRPDTLSAGEGTLDVSLEFKRRFCQRQLLHARYLPRTLSCTSMFNPYVTPGFPGVVFDSVDAGFAFAGFVLAVTHDFSAESATTSVEFNYVRMLDEAACVEIPNPLESVQMITHDERYLAPVYRSLLGTEGVADIAGAEPISYGRMWNENMGEMVEVRHPQTSPLEAYHRQRRNIVGFEDYCTFMGFTVGRIGAGPDGPSTVLELDGDFLSNRKAVELYNVPASSEGQGAAGSEKIRSNGDDGVELKAATGQEEKAEERTSISEQATAEKADGVKTRFADVRELLRRIAKEEFSKSAYK